MNKFKRRQERRRAEYYARKEREREMMRALDEPHEIGLRTNSQQLVEASVYAGYLSAEQTDELTRQGEPVLVDEERMIYR